MAQMIRKQIYISQAQENLIKRLASLRRTSEAEVIRQALERETTGRLEQAFVPDPDALRRVIQAGLDRRALGISGEPYQFRRDDAYEERLSRYDRPG
jgi:hypothetical protein